MSPKSWIIMAAAMFAIMTPGQCDVPRNIYGAHLLVDDTGTRGATQLKWARNLVGNYGYVKTLMLGITKDTQGPADGWVDWVNECYKLDLVPVCRLAGVYSDAINGWVKPEADSDGRYRTMAEAVKRVVQGLPRSDKYPLYIEVWNEPNLDVEWTGKADVAEYARFFVDVSKAIRSIGDSRIKIMNGAFGLSPKSTEICCQTDPDFINAFDVWASHPYPQNQPPERNNHNGKAVHNKLSIDGYLMETEVLRKYGRRDVKVMITETGYVLGEDVFSDAYGFPPIDEVNRGDYMLRAYRDYWEKWPELIAVIPFEFADKGWEKFNWVYPDSRTRADGTPLKTHYQYELISKLAKPSDTTGAISGKVKDARFGVSLGQAEISFSGARTSVKSDIMGNFIIPKLAPGSYRVSAKKNGFASTSSMVSVEGGKNSVLDLQLKATKTGSITGKVVDSVKGNPVPKATIVLNPGGLKAVSGKDGYFRLDKVSPIAYSAEAVKNRYNSHKIAGFTVEPSRDTHLVFKISSSRWPEVKNECSNPSFEIAADLQKPVAIAARWEVQGSEGSYEVVDGISHSGNRCQSISAATGRDTALRMISHYNYAKPGATYTTGVWVKTDGVAKGSRDGAFLSLDFQDNGGATLQSVVSQKISGSSGWTYLEATGVAPQCQRISVVVHLNAEKGIAYFDDAYLGMVGKPSVP